MLWSTSSSRRWCLSRGSRNGSGPRCGGQSFDWAATVAVPAARRSALITARGAGRGCRARWAGGGRAGRLCLWALPERRDSRHRSLAPDARRGRGAARRARRRGGAALVAASPGRRASFSGWASQLARALALAVERAPQRARSGRRGCRRWARFSPDRAAAPLRVRDPRLRPRHLHQRDLEPDARQRLRFRGQGRHQPLSRPPVAACSGCWRRCSGWFRGPKRCFALQAFGLAAGGPALFHLGAQALRSPGIGRAPPALAVLVLSSAAKRERLRLPSRSVHAAAVPVGLRRIRKRTTLGERTRAARSGRRRSARRNPRRSSAAGIGVAWALTSSGSLRQRWPGVALAVASVALFFFDVKLVPSAVRRGLRLHERLPALRRRHRRSAARAVHAAGLFFFAAHRPRAAEFSFLDAGAARVSAAFSLARGGRGAAALSHAPAHRRRSSASASAFITASSPERRCSGRFPSGSPRSRGASAGSAPGSGCWSGGFPVLWGRARSSRMHSYERFPHAALDRVGGHAVPRPAGGDGRLRFPGAAALDPILGRLSRSAARSSPRVIRCAA